MQAGRLINQYKAVAVFDAVLSMLKQIHVTASMVCVSLCLTWCHGGCANAATRAPYLRSAISIAGPPHNKARTKSPPPFDRQVTSYE